MARLKALLLVLVGVFVLGAFSGSALAASPQTVQEAAAESEERAEESEEQAEDVEEQTEGAAAAPFALALAQPAHDARRIEAITRSIRYRKKFIVIFRRSIRHTLTLPHNTTRWQTHLPKKRERLKAYRRRVRELRALRRELRAI